MPEPPRCQWPENHPPAYVRYHDEEWGVPVREDGKQFEFLILETAQAGLSWWTVLRKRQGYRRAFADFDPERVARFDADRVEELRGDASIIRNRAKIEAAVTNARAFLAVQEQYGSFAEYLWDFVEGQPIQNAWERHEDVPATTDLSDRISRDLKSRGFKFVGSTIVYAHLQATGLVNDHLVRCFRHAELA